MPARKATRVDPKEERCWAPRQVLLPGTGQALEGVLWGEDVLGVGGHDLGAGVSCRLL